MKNLIRPCPICDCCCGTPLHQVAFELPKEHPLAGGYEVVACLNCGFCFADIQAEQSDYDRYYTTLSKYADAKNSSGAGTSAWDQSRLTSLAETIATFDSDRSHRILDVGCASGGLLHALQQSGFRDLCGMDPSQGCVENTRRADVPAFQGSLFQLPSDLGKFDGIVLSHVLEHIRDLRPALQVVTTLLNSKGWVYIEVPDAMRYMDFTFAPYQDFNTEHINHFSLASLHNLLSLGQFATASSGLKEILSAPNKSYPAIFTFARPQPIPHTTRHDDNLRKALLEYVQVSEHLMARIQARIENFVGDGRHPIAIWGTGQLTMKLLVESALQRANIVAFIDSNPMHRGTLLFNRPVTAPENFSHTSATILIGSLIMTDSIIGDIKRLGLPNPVFTLK